MADEDLLLEKYQDFLDFDWEHEGWKAYLEGLYPAPRGRQLAKFRRKWYKKNVDPEFDETYEPQVEPEVATGAGTSSSSSSGVGGTGHHDPGAVPAKGPTPAEILHGAYADGTRWQVMRQKATLCLIAYGIALVLAAGSFAMAFSPHKALFALVASFVLDLLAKYGLEFTSEYMQFVLLDDVGVLPIMAVTLLLPGLPPLLRTFALTPFFLSATMSFGQICQNHPTLPAWFGDFFAPLANSVARYRLMEWRGHLEVALGFALVVGMFMGRAAPFSVLLFWNVMMMRYMMSPWTQSTFRKLDNVLKPAFDKVPGMKTVYAALKRKLYGFVDPESRQAGKFCTIL